MYIGAVKQLLFSFYLCLPLFSLAQAPSPILLDFSNAVTEQTTAIPFQSIEVMDVRFDRSNIGCVNKNVSATTIKRAKLPAVLPDSLYRYLPQMLQKFIHLEQNSKDTLVLLVKQFRLAERLINGVNLQYEPELLLKLSFSAFRLRDAQLTKLFSVDDLLVRKFPSDQKPKKDIFLELRVEGVMDMLQTVFQNRRWEATGASFPLTVVQEGIRKRYQLPLFTDPVLQTGVYKSFQEFKQNKPSLTNVHFRMRKDEVVAVQDGEGKDINLKSIWGVCNGKKQYIVFRGELCELLPSDKSFCFLSYIQTKDLAGLPGYGDLAPQAGLLGGLMIKAFDNTVSKEYFYLNMDDEVVHLEEVFGKSNLKQLQSELLK
jgi:hypothetical protein